MRRWLFSVRYWLPSERRALLRRLELAVEAGVHDTTTALSAWNREVPEWWHSGADVYVVLDRAWMRRMDRRRHAVAVDDLLRGMGSE